MPDEQIRESVEKLAEGVVLADVYDMPALAGMHTQFEELAGLTRAANRRRAADASEACAGLIEKIILAEADDLEALLKAVGEAVSAIRALVCDDADPAAVPFPPELGLASLEEADDAAGDSQFLKLPPNVDEAILSEFLGRQPAVLDEMEALVLALEQSADSEKLAGLRRLLHTLKGESALLGLSDAEHLCHRTEDVLSENEPKDVVDFLLGAMDWLGQAFDSYTCGGLPPRSVDAVLALLSTEGTPPETVESPQVVEQPAPEESASAATAPPATPEAIRRDVAEEDRQAQELSADVDLLAEFVSEANDHLEAADVHLLTLETDPQNDDALNAVFRAFHTIKGVAGFLALDDIGSLAHQAENMLDRARKGELVLSGHVMDVVFDSVDMQKRLMQHVQHALSTGEPLAREESLPELLQSIKRAISGESAGTTEVVDSSLVGKKLGEILVDDGTVTEEVLATALKEQTQPPADKKLGEIFVDSAMASRKNVDVALRMQQEEVSDRKLGELMVASGTLDSEDVEAALAKQQQGPAQPKLGETLVRDGGASARDVATALRKQKAARGAGAVRIKETLKVDADRLDVLVDSIGELVIAESMVHQALMSRLAEFPDLSRYLSQLNKIVRELQEMGMSLRMVPVRATFQKMARLVRDLSRKSGKSVNFTMSGEDTELDKTVVDRIGDPLVHMIRNAIDHGIEDNQDDRRGAGKPPAGQVSLRAFHRGGNIHIEIEDDGRGLDRDGILAKARERGLIRDGDAMSDHDVFNLIFQPGFSTARKVTDVSGRGVGMDVVRRNVEALRGQTDIRSEHGKGSVFTMRLPLTLAVIDGMVVRVGRERYILPTLSIVMSLRPEPGDLSTVLGCGEMLQVRGELIPVFRLHRLFSVLDAEQQIDRGIIVIIEDGERRAGLLVDEILGQQQTVIKTLGETMQGLSGIAGGAIMPDGQVGLILDVGGLVRLASTSTGTGNGGVADVNDATGEQREVVHSQESSSGEEPDR